MVLTVDRGRGHAENEGEKEDAEFLLNPKGCPEEREGSGNVRAGETAPSDRASSLDELIQPQKESSLRPDRVEIFQDYPWPFGREEEEDEERDAVGEEDQEKEV